jgi:hypothetical protein
MMTSQRLYIICIFALAIIFTSQASADRRHFVWTYQYQTMPAGSAELEHYMNYKLADTDNPDAGNYSHQLEIEVGITDRWDISLYQMFSQNKTSGFIYDGVKMRTRYRLFEEGQYPVDPLLYFEAKRPSEHSEPTTLEGKLVLAKIHNQFFTAFNFVVERDLGSGHELEWKYDFGVGYQLKPAISIGLESKGNFKSSDEGNQSFGPTFSVARGSVWFTSGLLFPMTDHASDFEFRYIMGIFL